MKKLLKRWWWVGGIILVVIFFLVAFLKPEKSRTVQTAKAVAEHAEPEVVDAVERGRLSLHAADQIKTAPVEVQPHRPIAHAPFGVCA